MRALFALALTSTVLLSVPVAAQEEGVRIHKSCSLSIGDAEPVKGPCTVATDIESIAIDIAGKSYAILFDTDTAGSFLLGSNNQNLDYVRKSGSCWNGPKVKFCTR